MDKRCKGYIKLMIRMSEKCILSGFHHCIYEVRKPTADGDDRDMDTGHCMGGPHTGSRGLDCCKAP